MIQIFIYPYDFVYFVHFVLLKNILSPWLFCIIVLNYVCIYFCKATFIFCSVTLKIYFVELFRHFSPYSYTFSSFSLMFFSLWHRPAAIRPYTIVTMHVQPRSNVQFYIFWKVLIRCYLYKKDNFYIQCSSTVIQSERPLSIMDILQNVVLYPCYKC